MTVSDGAALVAHVHTAGWQRADEDARFEILHLVDAGIVALRRRHNMPPFDDPVPGQPNRRTHS
jgi:hypothetical protein